MLTIQSLNTRQAVIFIFKPTQSAHRAHFKRIDQAHLT